MPLSAQGDSYTRYWTWATYFTGQVSKIKLSEHDAHDADMATAISTLAGRVYTVEQNTGLGDASTEAKGVIEIATDPEALAQAEDGKALVPSNLAAIGLPKRNNLVATADPGVDNDVDDGYSVGSLWVNATLGKIFMCRDVAAGAADWAQIDAASQTPATIAAALAGDDAALEALKDALISDFDAADAQAIASDLVSDPTALTTLTTAIGAGDGDVTGPGSSTSGNLVSWDGAGGDTLQDSGFPQATLVNLDDGRLIGNVSGSAGVAAAITAAEARTLLDVSTTSEMSTAISAEISALDVYTTSETDAAIEAALGGGPLLTHACTLGNNNIALPSGYDALAMILDGVNATDMAISLSTNGTAYTTVASGITNSDGGGICGTVLITGYGSSGTYTGVQHALSASANGVGSAKSGSQAAHTHVRFAALTATGTITVYAFPGGGGGGADGSDGADGADGADGNTILYGASDPTTEGVDGNFYINTAASTLFGPKASGSWPAGVSLIGPAGSDGADGADGAPGADGTDGAPGADGAAGADGVGVPAGGSTGQVLAKASATDYDTEWVASGGGGGGALTYLSTVSASADAEVVISGLGSYDWYRIICHDLAMSSDEKFLTVRTSTAGTADSGSTDYVFHSGFFYLLSQFKYSSDAANAGGGRVVLTADMDTSDKHFVEFDIILPGDSGRKTQFIGRSGGVGQHGPFVGECWGRREAAEATPYIHLNGEVYNNASSTANITGEFLVFGGNFS